MSRKRERRARRQGGGNSPEEMFRGLRQQVLEVDPATVGMAKVPDGPAVWGALMETGYPGATVTLVSLADGTTSLYTSSGFGIIGGGFHEAVVAATRSFLSTVENHLHLLELDPETSLPARGRVVIRALTYAGRYSAEAAEDDLGYGRHPLSGAFHAAHEVIAELRKIDEAQNRQR